jgi:hypothetical protein
MLDPPPRCAARLARPAADATVAASASRARADRVGTPDAVTLALPFVARPSAPFLDVMTVTKTPSWVREDPAVPEVWL